MAVPEVITSRSNPIVQRVRRLGERRHRKREGLFVVTGGQPVWRAAESGWRIDTLIACDELIGNDAARDMVVELASRGVRVVHVSPEVFAAMSDREGITGVAAVVEQRTVPLAEVGGDLVVVLDAVANPGNLGTIVRTADAVDAAAVVLVGDTTDPWAPAAVKASMGAVFGVPISTVRSLDEVFAWARDTAFTTWATSGYADAGLWDTPLTGPVAVIFGSEGDGLPVPALDAADRRIAIPMRGTAESLNLAVAAGVVLYDIRRRTPGWPA